PATGPGPVPRLSSGSGRKGTLRGSFRRAVSHAPPFLLNYSIIYGEKGAAGGTGARKLICKTQPVYADLIMEIQRIEPFLQYFERVRERTRRVVLCVPPERLEWTYKPEAFTFGDLIRHLGAIERWMFAENARCRPSRYPGHGQELAAG